MAMSLQNILSFIINENHTGYIKGRFIGRNIRIIEDVVYFTESENLPGIILTLDFEKAFDLTNWNFIDNALGLFNLDPNFRKCVKIMYTDTQSTILNNEYISEWFSPTQDIRQGYPLSAYIFIIAAETIAHKIREDKEMEGIKIGDSLIKISQLADDTTCLMKNHASLTKALETFKRFSIRSGLKIKHQQNNSKLYWFT